MTHSASAKPSAWPCGALGLLGICSLLFALISLGKFPTALDYAVFLGPDMQPLQWVTSLFIHAQPIQLLACMVFLLVVGSLVEDRLKLWWTCGLFLGLGAAGQGLTQMALLDHKVGVFSLGSAAGVSGWAGLLLVWSPLVKVERISKFALGKAAPPMWAILLAWLVVAAGVYLATLGPMSLLPPLASSILGAALGVVLLKNKVVEGENQDLLTLLTGSAPGGRKDRKKQARLALAQATAEKQHAEQLATAQQQLDAYLNAGQFGGAIGLLRKLTDLGDGLQISQQQLLAIIRGLHKEKKWEDSIPWLQQYLERFPDDVAMRLKLAQIFVVDQRLPGSGMEVLKPLADARLSEAEEKLFRQLERAACNMFEDDDIELEVEKRAR